MAGSMKDALRKAGLARVEPAPQTPPKKTPGGWTEELPEDETLPAPFDAPALTKAVDPSAPKKR